MTPSEIYYQTGKDTILYQSSLHREFSDRAFNLLNLSVATLVAGGVVINFRLEHLEWAWPLIILGTLAILASIVVAALCLSVLRTGDWYSFPPLSPLSDRTESLRDELSAPHRYAVWGPVAIYCGRLFQKRYPSEPEGPRRQSESYILGGSGVGSGNSRDYFSRRVDILGISNNPLR